MFAFCNSLVDLSPLKDWNVSNSTNFSFMFGNCNNLVDISPLQNWNVSNSFDFN